MVERGKDWPVVKIRSGPLGRDTTVEIDGKEMPKLTRVAFEADLDNATLFLHQFAIAEAELIVAPENIHRPTRVVVLVRGEGPVVESTADTLWQALADCSKQLELTAKKEAGAAET